MRTARVPPSAFRAWVGTGYLTDGRWNGRHPGGRPKGVVGALFKSPPASTASWLKTVAGSRFWIWAAPIVAAASTRTGRCSRQTAERRMSVYVVSAPGRSRRPRDRSRAARRAATGRRAGPAAPELTGQRDHQVRTAGDRPGGAPRPGPRRRSPRGRTDGDRRLDGHRFDQPACSGTGRGGVRDGGRWPRRSSCTRCSGTGCRRSPRESRVVRPAAGVEIGARRHEHPRRADPALGAAGLEERLLERVQGRRHAAHVPPAGGQPLDGLDRRPSIWQIGTRHESTRAPSTRTVHAPHSPSPQPSLVPVSAEFLAQDVEQPAHPGHVDHDRRAVDRESVLGHRARLRGAGRQRRGGRDAGHRGEDPLRAGRQVRDPDAGRVGDRGHDGRAPRRPSAARRPPWRRAARRRTAPRRGSS